MPEGHLTKELLLTTRNTNATELASKSYDLSDNSLIQLFVYDLQLRNLTPKTISCYKERMAYLLTYLHDRQLTLMDVARTTIHDYILTSRDVVSAETINGRLRVFKVFWNFLIAEGIWTGSQPASGYTPSQDHQESKEGDNARGTVHYREKYQTNYL